jgi:hypothetical protein
VLWGYRASLSFREVAQVMLGDVDAPEAEVSREAARLGKRFQLVKETLRKQLAAARAASSRETPT